MISTSSKSRRKLGVGNGAAFGAILAIYVLGVRLRSAWNENPTDHNLVVIFGMIHLIVEATIGALFGAVAATVVRLLMR
jgi:hypothetical protein